MYVALRALGAAEPLVELWAAAAVVLTLVSPVAGLGIVRGVLGPFTEAQTSSGVITPVPFLVVAVAVGVAVRLLIGRLRPRPSFVLGLALVVTVGTLLGRRAHPGRR